MSNDINEVKLSGNINNIIDNGNMYIKFGLTCYKSDNNFTLVSLNIHRDLYNKYKDFFVKGNTIFVNGYLNSYKDKNNHNQTFITVLDVSNNINGNKEPHIRYDEDGVMVWNGKRCESIPPTPEEKKEMEDLLNEYR